MLYRQEIDQCFLNEQGSNKISHENFRKNLNKITTHKANITKFQNGGADAIFKSTHPANLDNLKDLAKKIRNDFKTLILFGTGGSSLNPRSILALNGSFNNDIEIIIADNIDPIFLDSMFSAITPKNTAFLVISKSGSTIETVSQMFFAYSYMQKAGIKNIGKHFFVITEPKDSIICNTSKEIDATILDHDLEIGGRFATFTNVTLLPALISGLNAELFCKGASNLLEEFFSNTNTYPEEGAALALTAMESGININVLMPYVEYLKPLTAWISQIWAESLGKNGKGSTPLQAVGTLDQHSQLQLYLDGPNNKIFSILGLNDNAKNLSINSDLKTIKNIPYVNGRSFAEINNASMQGTIAALAGRQRPVRTISFNKLDEEMLGTLMMHFILETILTAQVLDINPFDQPAVEDGKVRTREILSSNPLSK